MSSWGYRSKWIARFAFLFLAAGAIASLRSDAVGYTFSLIGLGMLFFLTFDMYRKTKRLGREKAMAFTFRVAVPAALAGLIVWLAIRRG